MIHEITNCWYGRDDVIIPVIFYFGDTEKNIDKSPNSIKYYEAARKLSTEEYIFVR